MPPVLISSAAGKKAAPKGAIRRRPAAPGPAAPSSQATPSAATSVAPQSPPRAKPPVVEEPVQEASVQEKEPEAEVVESVSEPRGEQTQQEPAVQPVSQPEPEPTRDATPAPPVVDASTTTPAQPEAHQEEGAAEPEPNTEVPSDFVPGPNAEPEATPAIESQAQPTEPEEPATEITQPAEQVAQPDPESQLPPPAKAASKRTRNETPTATAPRPAKRAKRSSARSNATVQAETQADDQAASAAAATPAENDEGSATPAPAQSESRRSKRPSRKAPATQRKTRSKAKSAALVAPEDDGSDAAPSPVSPEEDEASETPAPKKPKQRRKKKQVRIAEPAEAEDGGEPRPEGEGEQQESDGSDPEQHEIDPNVDSMFDLTHESGYGKTSERGRTMAEIDWEEVARKRRDEANAIFAGNEEQAPAGEVVQSVEGPDGATESQAGDAEQAPAPQTNGADRGNEEFLVDADGNIVLDETTVRHDATAQAMQAAETGAVEDANDLTNQLNRTTWINNNRREPTDRVPLWKWKSDPWSVDETDRFYDALTMFGSDFFIISKMFPGKTRRMIKAKFNREEKQDPKRIDDALTGKYAKRMDLEHYSRETGRDMSVFTKYDGLEHAQGIINESMKDKHEAAVMAAQKEAQLAEEKAQQAKTEKREKSRTAKKARKKRAAGLGGEPEEAGAD